MLNLAHYLDIAARQYPEALAVKLDDHELSYAELAAAARRVASLLRGKGVAPGDHVALMLPNTPYFPMIYYGILHTGAAVVPMNAPFTRHEIMNQLEDSEALMLFAFEGRAEEAAAAVRDSECCRELVAVPDGEDFASFLEAASDDFDTHPTMPDDTAVLLYTSGTTGLPKGAELTHFNMFFNAYYSARYQTRLQPGETALGVLPLFHSFGQTCVMNACILAGAAMTLMSQFQTEKTLTVIHRDKAGVIAMVPTMYQWLLDQRNWQDYDLSSVRVALCGGSPLPEDVHARFHERYGIFIQEGYGLSETSPLASFTIGDNARPGSIGKPIWGVDMRIMREDFSFADPGEIGEIVIRGHNVMKGYFNRPEATEETIIGGWLHTGDLARVDEDGNFRIVDRKKDLILRGGMNIYPRELEEIFHAHPKVLEAAVIGIPHESLGEEVKVFIAPRAGQNLDPREIVDYAKEHMAKYKWPREVEILPALPKGATGKILKRALREQG